MKLTRKQLRRLIESVHDENDDDIYLSKIKTMLDGNPTIEDINQMYLLADAADVDMDKFRYEIAWPAFMKAVGNLGKITADDVKQIGELSDDIGLMLGQRKKIMIPVLLKAVESYSNPTVQDIKDLLDMWPDWKSLPTEDLEPIITKMTKRSNVLEQINIDNIMYEIDEILYRVRDIGLQSAGVQSITELEDSGQLSEDQISDTNMELVYSVKGAALEALERSISQIIIGMFQ